MAPYRCNHKLYEDYYRQQVGSGLPVFQGSRDQRGYGLGSLLGGLGRMMMPMLKRGGKALLQEDLNTGLDISRNVVAGENIKRAAKNRVRQAVTKPDGGALTDTDIVTPTNLYAEALFFQVDVSLNGNLTTPSQNTYPWRCFLESLSSYWADALGSQMALSGFSRDTAGELDNMDGEKNEGFAERAKWIKGSKECDMLCRVHADIFHQEKFLINGFSCALKTRLFY
ncbi:hypothetical protein PoB_003932200 [Plakobranchus ocellatus]|uniref:Uncharacterized protein n=1 Tax=Plakobranchus ocellatus TaxID=259542 RepID=A0AAV4AZX5_9GAST|nr:hypothetical protein PoB_003932200 [Plakobranchus ocellatus]